MDIIFVFGTKGRGSNPLEGTMRKIFFIAFLVLIVFLPNLTRAGLVPCGGPGQDPCTICHLFLMLNNIVKFIMFTIAPPLAVLMLIVGGAMFFFAGGAPTKIEGAKRIITAVFIGLLIIFCAWVIVNTIFAKTGLIESESILHWYDISCEVE